jgi:hypothetical protein
MYSEFRDRRFPFFSFPFSARSTIPSIGMKNPQTVSEFTRAALSTVGRAKSNFLCAAFGL